MMGTLLAAILILGACGSPTPTTSATAAATETPVATATTIPSFTGAAEEGKRLFGANACISCHGDNPQGTNVAPALGGHSAAVVRRQVRAPVGTMPVFLPESLTNDELGEIVAFITALPGKHGHEKPVDIGQEVALHHWMALLALEAAQISEATHHVEHINGVVVVDHLARMRQVLSKLEDGQIHDAAHTIEAMLAGTGLPGLTEEVMHIQLALSATRVVDVANAVHHIDHFLQLATGDQHQGAEDVLVMLQAQRLHDAEHELQGLLGVEVGEGDNGHVDEHEQDEEGGEEH
jgi:mono/diheme cytochrome c family protein